MKDTFRQSMTWLHTWVGLVLGWVCFAIFLTGTLSFYRAEITRWMRPELPASDTPRQAVMAAVKALEEKAPQAKRWIIQMPDERSRELKVYWQPPEGGRFQNAEVDPNSGGETVARDSYAGEFFYRFHFQLLLPHPWGRYTAGVAALVMAVALVTGVIAHRRFFADLFQFRLGRAVLRSWLDFHNGAGVLTLPFFAMITYSALVIFSAMYLPWAAQMLTPANEVGDRASRTAAAAKAAPGETAPWVAPVSLAGLWQDVERHWPEGNRTARIDVEGRGTSRATVTFTRSEREGVSIRSREQLVFDGVTGDLRKEGTLGEADGPGQTVHGVLYGLHMARFAGPLLRGLLFGLGLLGTGLIASGLVMWTLKRRVRLSNQGRGARFGLYLVERLNVTALAGMPLAIGGLFWANRLLPLEVASRADREVQIFLALWAVALVHACVRPVAQAWREQLRAGSLLLLALPVLDLVFARKSLLAAARDADGAYFGFLALVVIGGVALTLAAGKVGRSPRLKDVTPMVPATPVPEEVKS